MRYDISIIDDNIIQFEELERYSLNKLKNIKFTLFSDINNLNEDFDLTDLLVINIKFFEHFDKIKKILHDNILIVFLINHESDLKKISKISCEKRN